MADGSGLGRRGFALGGLLLLSALEALNMLRTDLAPNLRPPLLPAWERLALPLTLLAIASFAVTLVQRPPWPSARVLWSYAVVGFGLFVAPEALLLLAGRAVPGFARVALFVLTPIFALVFEPYLGADTDEEILTAGLRTESLLGALAAVAGALCIFPFFIPATWEEARGFGAVVLASACIAAANCFAVAVARHTPGVSVTLFAAIATAAGAVCFLLIGATSVQLILNWRALVPELAWSAPVKVPALLILFWLMHRLPASQMATRYILGPLIAVLVGALLLQPVLTLRSCLGLTLLTGGAVLLLRRSKTAQERPRFTGD